MSLKSDKRIKLIGFKVKISWHKPAQNQDTSGEQLRPNMNRKTSLPYHQLELLRTISTGKQRNNRRHSCEGEDGKEQGSTQGMQTFIHLFLTVKLSSFICHWKLSSTAIRYVMITRNLSPSIKTNPLTFVSSIEEPLWENRPNSSNKSQNTN